ncbi:hypothetical protein L596_007942 [Steinernema carpocapsae]|uniref:Eyes absent homolog n=1 Tax=Steinernema carpocapsae TaxID=34508 RepID=A0A4U5PAX7_STECR|nr:hypothetical protein L596_007942 [Steinernema carpocapsae]
MLSCSLVALGGLCTTLGHKMDQVPVVDLKSPGRLTPFVGSRQANKPASSAFRANSNVVVDPSRDLLGDSACRGSSVWSVLPSDPSGVSASLVATSSKVLESPAPSSMGPLTASATAQQTTALSAMQDAAAAYDPTRMITGSYYSHPYTAAASSGSYGVNSNYYQSLRNAAGFGYFPATPSSYGAYSTGGFDYTYPNCYGSSTGRNGYYGATGAAALGYFPAGSNYPNTLPDSKSSSSQISPLGQSLRCSDLKKTNGKSSKKKKTTNGTATPEEHYTRVFIWDLEDICAFSNVMLNAKTPDSVPMSDDAKRIVSRIISEVFHIDNGEISECEQVNIEDANVDETMQDIGGFGECPSGGENGSSPPQTMRSGVDWLRKVATRYQQVREAYNQCRNGASVFGDQSGLENQRTRALEMIKLAFMSLGGGAERWSDDVKACLGIISERSVSTARYANVVISNEGLVTSCAKLMATDLAPMVQIDNIYSTVKMTKDSVIERIRTKFGKNCSFVVISAQPDTQSLGKAKMIPTWRVMQTSHLEAFYVALKQYLLDHQHSNRQFREV